jgi:hypothetical protein
MERSSNKQNIFNSGVSEDSRSSQKFGTQDERILQTDNISLKSGGLGPVNERESTRNNGMSKGPAAMIRNSTRSSGFKNGQKQSSDKGDESQRSLSNNRDTKTNEQGLTRKQSGPFS